MDLAEGPGPLRGKGQRAQIHLLVRVGLVDRLQTDLDNVTIGAGKDRLLLLWNERPSLHGRVSRGECIQAHVQSTERAGDDVRQPVLVQVPESDVLGGESSKRRSSRKSSCPISEEDPCRISDIACDQVCDPIAIQVVRGETIGLGRAPKRYRGSKGAVALSRERLKCVIPQIRQGEIGLTIDIPIPGDD